MKRIIFLVLLTLLGQSSIAKQTSYKLNSPDGKLELDFSDFKYSVTVDGVQMLAPSQISMTLQDGTVYGGKASIQKLVRKQVDEVFYSPIYKRSAIRDNYNEMTLKYKDFDLVFRAYNEGVAYRFISKSKKEFTVVEEQADFSFPGNNNSYISYCLGSGNDIQSQLICSFENTYDQLPIRSWDPNRPVFLPIAVEAQNGYKIVITESDLFNFPGLDLYNPDGSTTIKAVHAKYPSEIIRDSQNQYQGRIAQRADYIAENCKAGCAFPWRIIQIAREDKELTNSDMVFKLATAPCPETDWSWVKPGKVAWDWWSDKNLYGVDFEAGINNATYKAYIDFASQKGIDYVLLDDGWSEKTDLFHVVPEVNLEELCQYAASKNVGIILWAGYWAVERDMEKVFEYYSKMGIKGFKIDYMDRDDQQMVNFYTACAQMGAKYKMVVDMHGAYKPTGLHRTYPNMLNFEGVHGLEMMKCEEGDKQVPYDVTIPFIRMVAGPMDYTQGAMRNASRANYRPIYSDPMSQGTRCRQLAEYVIFDAPFTMLCDSPSHYLAEPECTDFIAAIPTVWDETIALDGSIGKFVCMARRSGSDWYVGALTDWDAREISVDLSFLPEGEYSIEIFADGKNASRAACDYSRQQCSVKSGSPIAIKMAPGGGWVAKLSKK